MGAGRAPEPTATTATAQGMMGWARRPPWVLPYKLLCDRPSVSPLHRVRLRGSASPFSKHLWEAKGSWPGKAQRRQGSQPRGTPVPGPIWGPQPLRTSLGPWPSLSLGFFQRYKEIPGVKDINVSHTHRHGIPQTCLVGHIQL